MLIFTVSLPDSEHRKHTLKEVVKPGLYEHVTDLYFT